MDRNIDGITGINDDVTITSESLMETTELVGRTEPEAVTEPEGVDVKDTTQPKGVDVKAQLCKELPPKLSIKRKTLDKSCDGESQKDIPAGKRVLLSLPKRKYKWQGYKRPKKPQLYCSKKRQVSPEITKRSEDVSSHISEQSCERSVSCEQTETECVNRTDVKESVISESVVKESASEIKQGSAVDGNLCANSSESTAVKVDICAPVNTSADVCDTETELCQPHGSGTLDVSLRIDDGNTDSCQGAETGLHHLKMLTEELSQLGRDSATLVTARQGRKPKKRKQRLDEHVHSQQPVRRTSSPKRNVKQQANCDFSEAAFAEDLSSMASHPHDKKHDKGGDAGGSQRGASATKEMEIIDDTLEEKSKRFLLTAKNVRSIVHELVTNEQVLAMMCNTLQDDNVNDQLNEAVYEPKMTRSKVKEVIEMGQLPSPWILSPIKGSKTDTNPEPHFLEMTFSEDEEDEEYKPTEDELMAYSDVGTPVPLPLTSQQEDTADTSALKSDDDSHCGACDTATIALRTRSKLPLQDTPLEQIELGFVAPDISADMYDTYCDDSDWKNFLFSFVKFDARQDVNDSLDDEADPEYNFLAEVEKEEIDVEDFRNDRDVRVTKKELNELMDEVFEAYGAGHDQPPNKKTAKDTAKTKRQKGNKESSSAETGPQLKFVGDLPSVKGAQSKADESKPKDTSAVPLVTYEEKIQIQDQMRKHVQLLTQTYVQAGSRPELTDLTNLARLFLMELKALGDKAKLPHGMTSFLNPPNLLAALEVVGQPLPHPDETCNEDLKRLMVANFVPKNMYEVYGLNYEQMEVFVTSTVFMFPQMLPECCLLHCDHPGKKRVLFSQAEDNLLAMGIEQFGHLPNKYAFIEQYMLPTKKKQQLRYRLKNLKADRTTGENTIKYLSKHNQLPEFPRYLELEDLEDVVRPQDRDPDLLPVWCKAFLATQLNHESNCQTELTGVTGWVQVGSVVPPTASTPVVEKKETQEKKTPAAPSRKKSSKKVGVSGLNQFHKDKNITASTSSPPPSEGSLTDSTVLVETVGEDTVVTPVSDSQENASVGTHTPSKVTPSVVINAAVLSPGSLLGGTSAVKMTTMLRPGFPAASPVVSSPAVGIDEPLIMLTPRQLSQLGVKINMVPVGGDTKVQLSSPSGVDTLVSVASGGRRTPVLSSGPKIVEDRSMESGGDSLLSVALTGVTLSMSATTTKCSSSQPSPSPTADPSVTRLSKADSIPMGVNWMTGDTVNASHCVNVDMTDADVTGVGTHCHDDTVAANAVEQSVAASASLPVNSAVTVTTVDTVEKLVDTMTKPVDSSGNSDKSGISADVVSSKIVPCILAALTGSQNKTPQKMLGTPPQEKTSPCKCSLLYNSPSRKSTVFHRLQKPPEKTPPKAKKTISILPHPAPTLSMPDFSTGSPFYQSPSKQITFVQPPGGLSGFASTDTAVNRNLAFSLRSPSKNGSLAVNRRAVYISPIKKAAAKITARLKKVRKLRKLERILPKTVEASTVSTTDLGSPIVDTESCKVAGSRVGAVSDASLVRFSLDGLRENTGGDSKVIPLRPPTEAVTLREDAGGVESESDGESVKGVASRPESATEYEDDDNDDEDHLAQLMAASTTIRFAPKLALSETDICLTKAKKKRAVLLELLVPDLVAKDPLRDERDTAFAQAYLTTAKEVLLSNNRADIYEQLLKVLHDFGQSDRSPVELYQQLRAVLADFPELAQEFIVFLLPEQAKECNCFMAHLECQHARTFLRKLEVHLRKHPSHLQKIINIFLQWQNSQSTCDVSLLKEAIKPLLRGQQHLMEEFCWFFNDEQPPQSTLTEFEEVTLKDSDDNVCGCSTLTEFEEVTLKDSDDNVCGCSTLTEFEEVTLKDSDDNDALEEDSYEEVQLPEGDELLGSQWCKCQCHQSDVLLFHRRKRHCRACRSSGIKIIKGRIYVQTSESSLKPAHVVFHSPQESRGDPVPTDSHSAQPQAEANDDTVKVELGREDMEQSASPALGSSTRCPSEQAAVGQLPSLGTAPLASSRPRTTTTVCVSAAVEVCRTDSRRVDCVQETVSDQSGCTGPQSAADSVCHNPPVSGVLVGAVSETVSETLASADPGIGVTNCDAVVHCVEAGRQTEASMSGASALSLPICSWTKEEDKKILESCKQHGLGGSTFQTVAAALKKSADGVSKRFYELMQLFNEQPSDPSENDSDNESDGSPVG